MTNKKKTKNEEIEELIQEAVVIENEIEDPSEEEEETDPDLGVEIPDESEPGLVDDKLIELAEAVTRLAAKVVKLEERREKIDENIGKVYRKLANLRSRLLAHTEEDARQKKKGKNRAGGGR